MADKSDDKQVIFLLNKSRGAEAGARRTVDKATAERLVRDGLARYPRSK
jgi:hypothetical protein